MDNTEALSFLRESFKGKDWFFDADMQNGRLVVYAHFMSTEIMQSVPRDVEGKQVLLHFAASKKTTTESFVAKPVLHQPKPVESLMPVVAAVVAPVDTCKEDINDDVEYLRGELDRLEDICGEFTLESIFYEEHDKHNSITNLSETFPEVRRAIHILYEDFGFDAIYNEF